MIKVMAIINEKELINKQIPLEQRELASYIKLILIGPATLKANEGVVSGIPGNVEGYFITGDRDTLKAALHQLIDIAFQAQENANG